VGRETRRNDFLRRASRCAVRRGRRAAARRAASFLSLPG
jgi:hypothetical protein